MKRNVNGLPALPAGLLAGAIILTGLGCRGGDRNVIEEQPADPIAMAIPVKLEMIGQQATCAVTGDSFRIGRGSSAAVYREQIHYFKDDAALQAFLKAPREFMPDPPLR